MQHFDIVKMDPIIDGFNIMTYDLHGTWDGTDPYIGQVALAHTNLLEIEQSCYGGTTLTQPESIWASDSTEEVCWPVKLVFFTNS